MSDIDQKTGTIMLIWGDNGSPYLLVQRGESGWAANATLKAATAFAKTLADEGIRCLIHHKSMLCHGSLYPGGSQHAWRGIIERLHGRLAEHANERQ